VLATPVERREFHAAGNAVSTHGDYPEAMKELGAARNVPVVDLTTKSEALWQQLGPDGTRNYFLWIDPGVNPNWPACVEDNTHFQTHGAIELARIVVQAMVDRQILPRRLAIRLDQPVPDGALRWPPTVYPPPSATPSASAS
jgi:lysophospholipase L1-like esterase